MNSARAMLAPLLLLCVLHSAITAVLAARTIYSNQHFTDTSGNRIEAHGGGFLYVRAENKYFWYGESLKNDDLSTHGINAYSADDFSGPWKFEGMVFKNSDITLSGGPFVLERPKVLYNNGTQMYVMWFHIDNNSYNMRKSGVAYSSSPRGPFKFVRGWQPDNTPSMDLTLFADDDGQAYFVRNVDVKYVAVSKLSSDYLDTAGGVLSTASNYEAPAMVRLPGTRELFVIGSGLTGWAPNSMQMFHSKSGSLANPDWESMGNPTGSDNSFNSQPTFLWPLYDRCGQLYYLYMGDNWIHCGPNPSSSDLYNACYVWLPMKVSDDGSKLLSIGNRASWNMDDPFELYGSGACPKPGPRPQPTSTGSPAPTPTGSPSPTPDPFNVHATEKCGAVSEGSSLTLSCPTGGVISSVDFASFGSFSGVCTSFSTGTCQASNSKSVVQNLCVGKPSCTVSATTGVFGDPCPGTGKTLAVQVSCSTCGSAPWHQKLSLSCGKASITSVGFASFGTPTGNCYTGQWSAGNCNAPMSSSMVQNACVGKSSCSVMAENPQMQWDPCFWFPNKMLAATVACSSCGTAGEHNSVTVKCEAGSTITGVAFASYGQPSGSCSTTLTKGSCHAFSSASVVQSACVGKSSCTVSADNDVFGEDPCAGVGKSLAFSVICG